MREILARWAFKLVLILVGGTVAYWVAYLIFHLAGLTSASGAAWAWVVVAIWSMAVLSAGDAAPLSSLTSLRERLILRDTGGWNETTKPRS